MIVGRPISADIISMDFGSGPADDVTAMGSREWRFMEMSSDERKDEEGGV